MMAAAVAIAKQFKSALAALSFLLGQGLKHEAATLVLERWHEFNGEHYYTLRPASEELGKEFPLPAVLLRRRLVEATLEKGNSKYYKFAIDDLKQAGRVSLKVKDWKGLDDQAQFILRLKTRHGKKTAFWTQYER
jgi:hypothetical protein